MKRAQMRDAVSTQKFHFRQSIMSSVPCSHKTVAPSAKRQRMQQHAKTQFGGGCQSDEMTIREILMGNGSYKGLVPMVMAYLHAIGTDTRSLKTIES